MTSSEQTSAYGRAYRERNRDYLREYARRYRKKRDGEIAKRATVFGPWSDAEDAVLREEPSNINVAYLPGRTVPSVAGRRRRLRRVISQPDDT